MAKGKMVGEEIKMGGKTVSKDKDPKGLSAGMITGEEIKVGGKTASKEADPKGLKTYEEMMEEMKRKEGARGKGTQARKIKAAPKKLAKKY